MRLATPLVDWYVDILASGLRWPFFDVIYEGVRTQPELDAARRSETLAEDRWLLELSGALPSEVWA